MAAIPRELDEPVVRGGQAKKLLPATLNEDTVINLKLLMGGGIAGAAAKTVTAPLARLTILYQVQGFAAAGAHQPPLFGALAQVVRREGVQALWKGNMATVLHRLPYSAVSFLVYEKSTSFLQSYFPKDKDAVSGRTDVARRLVAGGLAGLTGTLVAYPLDLIRTRLSAQTTTNYYNSISHAFKMIIRDEGARGLYKGIGGSLAQVGPNLALNYCAYETLRSYWVAGHPDKISPGVTGSLLCGGLAGFMSSTVTFPVDLVRRRMQLQGQQGMARQYTGYVHVARDILQKTGWRGFYTGIIPEYCKVMPTVAIIYTTFEMVKRALHVDDYNAGQR